MTKVTRNSASVAEDRESEDPEHLGAVYLALPGLRPEGSVWHVPNGIGCELVGVPEQSELLKPCAFTAEALAQMYFRLPPPPFATHWLRNIVELRSRLAHFESVKAENVATSCAQMAVKQLKATARTIAVFMVNNLVRPWPHRAGVAKRGAVTASSAAQLQRRNNRCSTVKFLTRSGSWPHF